MAEVGRRRRGVFWLENGQKRGWGAAERVFFWVFALRNGVGRGVFLRRSARFFTFLRGSVLKGVVFAI